jgi:hypothetical protein
LDPRLPVAARRATFWNLVAILLDILVGFDILL